LDTGRALSERELELEMADVLPRRETLAISMPAISMPAINVAVAPPDIAVVTQVGTAVAVAVGGKFPVAIAVAYNHVS